MIKNIFHKMNIDAVNLRKKIILDFLDYNPEARILDLGCDDGSWSLKLKEKTGAKNIYGVDLVRENLEAAKSKGINIEKADLNKELPFKEKFFDIVHADQVIEHIAYLDRFVSEIYRVLKPGGYVIISTENGSSWHNIFAAILGWQIFSLTNISAVQSGIGNPLAIHRFKKIDNESWTHKTIFNFKGLIEFFEIHKFTEIKVKGSGYHPLPPRLGKLDPRHSHYITLKAYKK